MKLSSHEAIISRSCHPMKLRDSRRMSLKPLVAYAKLIRGQNNR